MPWLDDGTLRWFFDGGALSIDVAAMPAPVVPADVREWIDDAFPGARVAPAEDRDLADALALREVVARLIAAAADGSPFARADVDTLNLFAATPDVPPVLPGGGRQAGAGRIRVGQGLSSIARDAIAILRDGGAGRIRRCADPACRMVFHDASRTNSRRWCSMQRCGNRAKARAHRSRAVDR